DFAPGFDTGQWFTYAWVETITRNISPYDINPFNFHPLREVLEKVVVFEDLQDCDVVDLFVCATNVRTGKVKVFDTPEVTVDAVLASACLPFLFQAVEINGEHYWDGGYIGNPSLWPLFYETQSRDILVIQLNPMERQAVPQRSSEILNRINEISFNASLIKEMRAIAFAQKLVRDDWLKEEHKDKVKDILFHAVRADRHLCDLSVASKFNTEWRFFLDLFERGRAAAQIWFEENGRHLGVESSVDLHAEFLDE
ncbi:MAG: patatin-like phospholipase family protein, partial [Pseudomonadota bacterium]